MIKFIRLSMLLVALSSALPTSIFAKKKENNDSFDEWRIEVFMKDGNVEKGRLKSHWTKFRFNGGFNTKMSIMTDDGRKLDLTVEDMDSIHFPERPDNLVQTCVISDVAIPKLRNKEYLKKLILYRFRRSLHAEALGYDAWVDVNYGSIRRRERVTVTCIKMDGDPVAYPFFYPKNGNLNPGVLEYHMKKKNPVLAEYLKAYFKDKANKEKKKAISKDPYIFLDIYEEFLNQQSQPE